VRPLLLILTTFRRLALPVLVFLVWAPAAHAWTWPVQGPVLQAFVYDESHPYASGQHRGIDIGADAAGETVVSPAACTVSFAGTVPTNGKSVTIETLDGYSVTLTHLGSILVVKGATVGEGDAVGTIGPSGTPELDEPYVHLGIRATADPNGYLDPLRFLPPPAASEPAPSGTQPSASASSTPAGKAASPGSTSTRGSTARLTKTPRSRVEARPHPTAQRPAVQAGARASGQTARTQRRVSEPASSTPRPVVEAAVPNRPAVLGPGHQIRPSAHVAHVQRPQPPTSSVLLALACNGAAALVALIAALAAGRRRRPAPITAAKILHLPRPAPMRRAA